MKQILKADGAMKGVQMIILVVDEKFVSKGKRSHRAHLYKAMGKHLR